MDYRDNRQRWAESHQVVHFYAGQWCTFTPALTRIERRPPKLDLDIYPYLPRANVATTAAASYMSLLGGGAS